MYVNQKALKAVIKEHLSACLKPKRPKSGRPARMTETQVMEMIKNTVQETLKEYSMDIEKIMVKRIEAIDWKEKAKETVKLMILQLRGKVV